MRSPPEEPHDHCHDPAHPPGRAHAQPGARDRGRRQVHRPQGLHRLRRRLSARLLAIDFTKGTAYMKFDECWYCMPCEKDCPTGAVHVEIPYLLR